MKRVVFSILAVSLLVISCKNDTPEPEIVDTSNDLALAETSEISKEEYLYVTAFNGLSLREFNNLNSEKLAVMPYGTKLKVISSEDKETMTVGGIKGAMHKVEYNHKNGFAFNGYLSKFFPPEQDQKAKYYAEELIEFFPTVNYAESVGGSASKPSNSQTLVLPTKKWHEAFFVAQRLFDFPKEFKFPGPKGKDTQIIKGKKSKSDDWTNELHITRKNNQLEKIEYLYALKGYKYNITMVPDGEMMVLKKTEIVE